MKAIQVAAIILLFAVAANLRAETICLANVSYKWEKKVPEKATPAAPVAVEFGRTQGLGADEAAAKTALAEQVAIEKNKARESCHREHENTADCLASKYSAAAAVINSLRFEARKGFEQAIISDCSAREGRCLEVSASDPQCAEKVVAAKAAEGAAADAGKGGKGAGKEKKK